MRIMNRGRYTGFLSHTLLHSSTLPSPHSPLPYLPYSSFVQHLVLAFDHRSSRYGLQTSKYRVWRSQRVGERIPCKVRPSYAWN